MQKRREENCFLFEIVAIDHFFPIRSESLPQFAVDKEQKRTFVLIMAARKKVHMSRFGQKKRLTSSSRLRGKTTCWISNAQVLMQKSAQVMTNDRRASSIARPVLISSILPHFTVVAFPYLMPTAMRWCFTCWMAGYKITSPHTHMPRTDKSFSLS